VGTSQPLAATRSRTDALKFELPGVAVTGIAALAWSVMKFLGLDGDQSPKDTFVAVLALMTAGLSATSLCGAGPTSPTRTRRLATTRRATYRPRRS
jgi:hypothetical protein